MNGYKFTDCLTGCEVVFDYQSGKTYLEDIKVEKPLCKSIFFPGCSFINYAIPLVDSVYQTLKDSNICDGISVLCCGKILSYEQDGIAKKTSFEEELCRHIVDAGIERIVCACPNCVKAMREMLSLRQEASEVQIEVLPKVLFEMGYKVDKEIAAKIITGDSHSDFNLCIHDSCPDREYGDFADGLREILPEGTWSDPLHCRNRSVCCGSLPRAKGKFEQADKCANINRQEALDLNSDAIVTACVSCAFQINMVQNDIKAIHYLELLYDLKIDWDHVDAWMKTRFLFDDYLGVEDLSPARKFVGLSDN